jgi:hypothetical protein
MGLRAFLKLKEGAVQNTTPAVSSVTLMNAMTGQTFPGYETIESGAVISLSGLAR